MAIIFKLDALLASNKLQSVELAEQLGYTVQTISRIKKGKVKSFRIETLDSLCSYFKCQPGELLEYIDDDEARERFGDSFMDDYKQYFDE